MYLGTAGMKAQMKYADKRGAPCVVIQGGDERAKGEVQIKDLIEGAKAAATIKDSKEWREGRPAQVSVPEADLVAASATSSRGTRVRLCARAVIRERPGQRQRAGAADDAWSGPARPDNREAIADHR